MRDAQWGSLAADDSIGVDGFCPALGSLLGGEEGVAAAPREAAEDAGLDEGTRVVVAIEAKEGDDGGSNLYASTTRELTHITS